MSAPNLQVAMRTLANLDSSHASLMAELRQLVRLLEPLERGGTLNVPGLATLNGARRALLFAELVRG